MNGVYAPVEEGLRILKKLAPSAAITASGQPLAFPMHLPDKPLRDFLGDYGEMPLAEGIRETYEAFRSLIRRGMLSMPEAASRRTDGRDRAHRRLRQRPFRVA